MLVTSNVIELLQDLATPKLPPNPYGPEFTQMAVYCRTPTEMVAAISEAEKYGRGEWMHDMAIHKSILWPGSIGWKPLQIKAFMAFNYQLIEGIEFELMYWEYLSSLAGPPRTKHPFDGLKLLQRNICMTYRVECVFAEEERLAYEFDLRPWYRLTSTSHTNENVRGRARYRDTMYDTAKELGYNLRICCKIPWEPYYVVPRGSGVELNPIHFGHDISDSEFIDGRWYRHGWEPK